MKRQQIAIFTVAFLIRALAAVGTTFTSLNPSSKADAVVFGDTAEKIAQGLREGQPYLYTSGSVDPFQWLFPLASVDIYTLWGTFLAPFWLLPGPSGLYVRLANAFLGAFAVYNVYHIAYYYHSHHAGVVASVPMIFYPSFVAVHSTVLRDPFILFGITAVSRILMLPSKRRTQLFYYGFSALILHVSLLLRDDNVVIYAVAITAVLIMYAFQSGYLSKEALSLGIFISPLAFIISLPIVQDAIEFLAYIREVRAGGRAVYLPDVIPQTVSQLAAFSWVGAAYFLYAPFPWMIQTIPDLIVSFEGIVSIVFTLSAARGVRSLAKKKASATTGLVVGLVVAVVLYGVGTVNYGTGMRHRQMFLWVIFLFGGIGISEYVRFVWPFEKVQI
ncbi:hypothetical protein [Halorubrum distributum]|uniref:hypothetical protein n=1 Tax=Halorubrum distributum TaxID=29283 RepID=UPI0012694F79|nr:hypothetical protein [Halorubrum arcis]